jgi:hypothetical protein
VGGLPHGESIYSYEPSLGRIVVPVVMLYFVRFRCAENRYRKDVGILVPIPLTPRSTFPSRLGSAKQQAPSYREHLPNHAITWNADRQTQSRCTCSSFLLLKGLPHSAMERLGNDCVQLLEMAKRLKKSNVMCGTRAASEPVDGFNIP